MISCLIYLQIFPKTGWTLQFDVLFHTCFQHGWRSDLFFPAPTCTFCIKMWHFFSWNMYWCVFVTHDFASAVVLSMFFSQDCDSMTCLTLPLFSLIAWYSYPKIPFRHNEILHCLVCLPINITLVLLICTWRSHIFTYFEVASLIWLHMVSDI